jgi:hypothetical protein
MIFKFEWNPLADQPHNVAPRSERMRHHFRRWRTYFALAGSNLVHGPSAFLRYRRFRRIMYKEPVAIRPDMFAVSVSPADGREDEILDLLQETGVRRTLFRAASWERERLAAKEDFARRLRARGFEIVTALLQRREDVFRLEAWSSFLDEAFIRLGPHVSGFEIGHAWNRTKWGVWDQAEYIGLAREAVRLRSRRGVRLIGPAVIDFEFHLYPPVLRAVDFDVASSLLYVDRVGAPENEQSGWNAEMKFAAFKALAESGAGRALECWITEVNWPLEGTGRYSPASGKPNVSEEEQADYLVRYYILSLASGLIGRVYWWQLVAPGYGLVDSRESPWRRRPSFFAFKTMVRHLTGSVFIKREQQQGGNVFRFRKDGREFAVAWTNGVSFDLDFSPAPTRIIDRDGNDLVVSARLRLDAHPKYIF